MTPTELRESAQEFIDLVKEHYRTDLGFNELSLIWVDEQIERIREHVNPDTSPIVDRIGAFLGETIIATYGGDWEKASDGTMGVRINPEFWVNPILKTYKHFVYGKSDSIYDFFSVLTETDRVLNNKG